MKLLDAVNLILPKLGEHPVTSLTQKHPTLAIILPEVENELKQVLLRGWWFNEFEYTAYPDNEGNIFLGSTTLSFTPTAVEAVQRGNQLYNPETLSYVWTEGVKGIVKEYVEFDLLPESAAQYVWHSALVNVYVTDIGLGNEIQLWSKVGMDAYKSMLAEHLRNRKYSTTQSYRFLRMRRAVKGL